ncbi:MAG: PTS sugar transporter subunit IIA [Thermoanaerobaculum sp.]|nr:PTS sugar transporter subunit IIA [Thermoanaerobaculum sp.]MDW7967065.1 PTS sugar transporter subunit IIA [Thermoanaerobaculum sp.]
MDTILDALQEGRLFELPQADKTAALQFLAHVIEAFPEVPAGTDVFGYVLKREEAANTGLGKGWACPHARLPFDEDLKCVIGWSPTGIDYGAPDGQPVVLVVMYLVPENQRNHYLREVSLLAKALQTYADLQKIFEVRDLDGVRNYLLDLVDASKRTVGPDTRARMIRLQAKPAPEALLLPDLSNLAVEPLSVVVAPNQKPILLTQSPGLLSALEGAESLPEQLQNQGVFHNGGWRVLRHGTVSYQGGVQVFECLAVKVVGGGKK